MQSKFFTALFVLLIPATILAQQATKTYHFTEINWTIHLPSEFITLTSDESDAKNRKGLQAVEETNDVAGDLSQLKTLIAATKKTHNYFNATLTPFNPKKDGPYAESGTVIKQIIYNTFKEKMPGAIIDSSSAKAIIDGQVFDKFQVTIKLDTTFRMELCLLSKFYKGYDFGISYVYLDEETKQQIETMLKTSRFGK